MVIIYSWSSEYLITVIKWKNSKKKLCNVTYSKKATGIANWYDFEGNHMVINGKKQMVRLIQILF